MALKKHKNNRELYDLFKFYVGNGLFPPTAVQWIKALDARGDRLTPGEYDREAHNQLVRFLSRCRSPDFWNKAVYYDLNLKRIVRNGE